MTNGTGTILPPGTSAAASLPPGPVTVTIESALGENDGLFNPDGTPAASDHVNARCVYPDGFVKSHQVTGVEDLAPKVVNQLRGRYGATEVKIVKLPAELSAGATIEMEV